MAVEYPCRHPGCKNTVLVPGYCPKHVVDEDGKARKAGSTKMGYDRRWREARMIFLRANPLCKRCGKEASDVDHIVPHKGNKNLFWDSDNWQALCEPCHIAKTAEDEKERKPVFMWRGKAYYGL